MEVKVNSVSSPPALVLNGDGRSFAGDLNLTASLMDQSSLWGTLRPRHE